MSKLITRASSINRALDQIGDKWCLLILQEVFWGINSFGEMMAAMGVSRSVLADRLRWLQTVDCLRKQSLPGDGRRQHYHLTRKSIELYDVALMAVAWERQFAGNPELDAVELVHLDCNSAFVPELRCGACSEPVAVWDVDYRPGPGASRDERDKKVRRRSSIHVMDTPNSKALYRNLIHLVGDRWTANLIALSFHGLSRFEQFHDELPIATNILTDRLRFLVEEGVFMQSAYQQRPPRYEYQLSEKGAALYPWFLALLQWGDKWCDPQQQGKPLRLRHRSCGKALQARVTCSNCGDVLKAHRVEFNRG